MHRTRDFSNTEISRYDLQTDHVLLRKQIPVTQRFQLQTTPDTPYLTARQIIISANHHVASSCGTECANVNRCPTSVRPVSNIQNACSLCMILAGHLSRYMLILRLLWVHTLHHCSMRVTKAIAPRQTKQAGGRRFGLLWLYIIG